MLELSIAQKIAIWALPLLFAITLHEVAHGWVASKFGDQTARLSGRLTLNPIAHIDLVGTIILPLFLLATSGFIFGWAKPVPVDSRNMKNPRRDMAIVSFAGPMANLLMALIWGAIGAGAYSLSNTNPWLGLPLLYMGEAGVMINIVLGVLNFLPIPPLDGAKMILVFLPKKFMWYFAKFEPYGILVLLALMFTGVLGMILYPPITFISNAIRQLYGLP